MMTAARRLRMPATRPSGAWILLTVVAVTMTQLGTAGASALGAPPGNATWYVDCSAPAGGNGTMAAPFDSLQSANQLTLGPGDQLLFRRGTVCPGMLAPRGNGAPGDPIVIGQYAAGSPFASLPTISGGGTVTAAVWLADMSDVTVEDLQLTNAGNSTGVHRGLYFTSNTGPVSDLTVRDLEVDNVDGDNSFTGGKQGGGIVGQALSSVGRFSNVMIEDNFVHDVSRQGITIYGTTSGSRPPATSPWPQASTGVVIEGNTVQRVQGDGIVPLGTDGAVVQHNLVEQGNLGGYNWLSSSRNCAAGIWAWDANNTLIQYNEVSGMAFGPSTNPSSLNGCDGEGFDADYNQDGTVIQYNYSHDNAGGFILLCTDQSPHRVVIRYNLSVDDNATFNPSPCALVIDPATNNLDGVEMYNNTIVAPTPRVTVELDESLAKMVPPLYGSFEFENNIVDATSPDAANHYFWCGTDCTNNVFSGMPVPSGATNSVTADPQFLLPWLRGSGLWVANAFRLRPSSPALGAGVVAPAGFPPPATHDFFGVPVNTPPTIGFSESADRWAAPAVTAQPASAFYTTGESLDFTAAASGIPAPNVQWQYSANAGATWANVPGATATTLSVGPLNGFVNGWEVRAVFANRFGSAASAAATVRWAATSVLRPSNGATVSGRVILDAAATSGATQVRYELIGAGRGDQVVATGTLTLFGWLSVWNAATVAAGVYSLVAVATFPGGVVSTSAPVTITVGDVSASAKTAS